MLAKFSLFQLAIALLFQLSQAYPPISTRNEDPAYRFIQQSVEAYYRSELGSAPAPELVIFTLDTHDQGDLVSLAARFSLPPGTIASLNGLANQGQILPQALLIPNQPGIFVPRTPQTELDEMLSTRLGGGGLEMVLVRDGERIPGSFHPGQGLSARERLLFVQRYFGEALRSFRISAHFGLGEDPFRGTLRYHQGVDMVPTSDSQEVLAAAAGTVAAVNEDQVYGKYIIISHDANFSSLYAHLSSLKVQAGDMVQLGQVIATVGSTGLSTGPHLHFEIRRNGLPVDPGIYIRSLRK